MAGADTVELSMCPNGGHVTVFVDECIPRWASFYLIWIEATTIEGDEFLMRISKFSQDKPFNPAHIQAGLILHRI